MIAPIRRGAPRRPVGQGGGLAGALALLPLGAAGSVSPSVISAGDRRRRSTGNRDGASDPPAIAGPGLGP
jgi:hypothetical protein